MSFSFHLHVFGVAMGAHDGAMGVCMGTTPQLPRGRPVCGTLSGAMLPLRTHRMVPAQRLLPVGLAMLASLSCGPTVEPGVTVLATADVAPLVQEGLAFVGDPGLHLTVVTDPRKELSRRGGAVVALSTRDDCADCFRVDGEGTLLSVSGGAPLGVQYGLWHALELMGYRFLHPWRSLVPAAPGAAPAEALGVEHQPEVRKRRGLHLHTLHPIEAMYDFCVPGEANLEGAKRTIDFIIKNRGNSVQWAALDDVVDDAARLEVWRAHVRAITSFAHARGVSTGIALQLFGQSNLQNAFDLIDDDGGDPAPELRRRLHLLLDGNGFDALNLSFGEFFAADPDDFIAQVNRAWDEMQAAQPGVEVMATIHVGNYPNLRVTWQGQTMLYYFLATVANQHITPWIHSVMYYNLYEDAGLAYLHDEFDEHRAYLEAKLRDGRAVGYFPESAYWIAFDINVPTYLPVYVRSRWLDLERLSRVGRLDDHVLFSSGWEWGYWLNDAATLRMTYERPAAWDGVVQHVFAGWGDAGRTAGELVRQLGEVQHHFLIEGRLAAYLAGRDQLIDAGERRGIVSQPDRPEFSEVAALDADGRATFVSTRLGPLADLAAQLTGLDEALGRAGLPAGDAFLDELRDGFAVTAARARFIHALYAATVAFADGGGDDGWLAKADDELQAAKRVVQRRHRQLFDPDARSILRDNDNPTFYKYGYLREADSLCFWTRELAQARRLMLQTGDVVPGCVL